MNSQKPLVLLIEDEHHQAMVVKQALEELSHGRVSVTTCHTGREAAQALFKHPFTLIISDLNLPDVSGMAFLRQVRKTKPHIKTILITAQDSPQVRAQAKQFADVFLAKPFDPIELLVLVAELLGLDGINWDDVWGNSEKTPAPTKPAPAPTAAPTAAPTLRVDSSNEAEKQCPTLHAVLQNLNFNVSGYHTALLDVNGHILLDYGEARHPASATLNILLANSMASSGEVGRRFSQQESFLLHYYGNEQEEIYACAVNHDTYLVLAIDLRVTVARIGSVWMYLKRAVSDMRDQATEMQLLKKISSQLTSENFSIEVESALTEALFGDDFNFQ
jgi:CheY-like chemotaxis protein